MDEWCPFAVRRDGPDRKVGYPAYGTSGPKRGEVKHSAEGRWGGIHQVLDGTRPASWQFTIGYDRIEQHYPLSTHCWHAGDVDDDGGVAANLELIGVEHLGVTGEPLTEWQVDATVRVTKWASAQFMRDSYDLYPKQDRVWTLAEHNQVSNLPTACPSGRIPWLRILRMLQEDEPDMIDEEARKAIADLEKKLEGQQNFQNAILIDNTASIEQHDAQIEFLSKVVVDHEARVKGLENA